MPSAVHTAVDFDVLLILSEAERPFVNETVDYALLLRRFLRLMGSISFVASAGPDQWLSTLLTDAMTRPEIASGPRFVWDIGLCECSTAIYFQPIKYVRPSQRTASSKSHTRLNTIASNTRPGFGMIDWHTSISSWETREVPKTFWVDWYPVTSQFLDDYDTSSALLVDVGAGKGHALQAFASKVSRLGSRNDIFQDLQKLYPQYQKTSMIISNSKPQDFFTPNQAAAARADFLRHILHDWSHKYWHLSVPSALGHSNNDFFWKRDRKEQSSMEQFPRPSRTSRGLDGEDADGIIEIC
ncbi:hypothetical protein AC579_10516 [Pseudocercospora musae]|uniref:O-methyltransferase domain-containing protein n=1 Tax=Pseudocercospora musae TaxID=113226 RepID=A0A139I503_9PEZI|nr:hypothetical protein AC579_10516 [Pseudocercospora musae]